MATNLPTLYIVVSDYGDDEPEYFGPFSTLERAEAYAEALAQALTDDDPNVPWSNYVCTEVLQAPHYALLSDITRNRNEL